LASSADQAQAATKAAEPLTTMGAVFMVVSVGFVTVLTVWCFVRVLSQPEDSAKPPAGLGA
jgi:heme/copper-type cytochrome/quinol oxidase subunit 2